MPLYEHQKVELDLLTDNNAFALFAEQGTGKTLPMLYHLTNLLASGEIDDALVICPPSIVGSWERDVALLPKRRHKHFEKITVVSCDTVWRRTEYDKEWGAIVVDESHNIAHRETKRTKYICKLGRKAKCRYILTGTPIHNKKLEDYYSQMDFLIPGYLGTYREFLARYCVMRRIPGTYREFPVSYRNTDELLDKIKKHAYYVRKSECLDLPEMLPDQIYDCELKEKAIYKELVTKKTVMKLEINAGNPLTLLLRLRTVPCGFIVDEYKDKHILKTDKPKVFDELLDSISGKIVVYANWRHSIETIKGILDKKKIKYVVLDGEQTNKKIWKEFQEKEEIRVILCQYQSANAGIDLFAASDMIFYEPHMSSSVIDQCKSRTHRNGQKNPCSYYWLLTKGTVEYDIYEKTTTGIDYNVDILMNFLGGK